MSDRNRQSREASVFAAEEYEREPVPENKTKGLRSFLGLFASEHVAGTELVIGPLFVAHGVSAFDLLVGLLVGNFLAVMSWTLLTAPIAVKKRLTLYYQLEKIGGAGVIDIYNIVNGILWCCLGGAMIYVSASIGFVLFDMPVPADTAWLPNSIPLVLTVLAIGTVIAFVAARGYDAVAHFANIAAPWMVVMFIVFGLACLPELGIRSVSGFWRVANNQVWVGHAQEGRVQFTFWHVMCFAWFGNMAWHLGMGDLSVFRYAKKARYGLASAAGMYFGHYIAWIAGGLLYAVHLKNLAASGTREGTLAAGPMAFAVAGYVGLLLVVVAGWTTANPIIYRAGLAFQAVRPTWPRAKVTLAAGAIATIVGMFPGLCNKFLSVAMLYGLVLVPMGAVIFADHYLVRRFGLTESYAEKHRVRVHWAPVLAWLSSLLICLLLYVFAGIQEFFLCLPGWIAAGLIYLAVSKLSQRVTVAQEVAV
jgi:purine-cytosine permease-like protein